MTRRHSIGIAALLCVLSMPVSAHHSFNAGWYEDKTVEITGVVQSLKIIHPHGELLVEVTEPDGKKAVWYIISKGSGRVLMKSGWSSDTLPVGSKVKVQGNPSRREGAKALAAGKITKEDGTEIWFGGGGGIPVG